jgi:hypothetical protein
MTSPKVTEVNRLSAHRREVVLVRQSLLSGMSTREQVAQNASRLAR